MNARWLATGLGVASTVSAAPAVAYHTKAERITDQTAYTLQKKKARVGLFKVQWAPLTRVMIGTHTLPWILRMANLHAKWTVHEEKGWAYSLAGAGYRLDLSTLEAIEDSPGNAIITVGVFEPALSHRFSDAFTYSASAVYTEVRLDGDVNAEIFEGALQGAVDNFQLTSTLEWRVSRVTAFVVHGRYLVFQRVFGDARAEIMPDEFTTIEIEGGGATDELDFPHAFSVVPSMAFSWKRFNLRFGVGYGNWSLPLFNFVLPNKTPIVDLAVYWVF